MEKGSLSKLVWKPSKITRWKMSSDNMDRRDAFKAFRSSSGGFINKPVVRRHVLAKCDYKCVYCNSTKGLQIDHIKSVYMCFKSDLLDYCNSIENLQALCSRCNLKKS